MAKKVIIAGIQKFAAIVAITTGTKIPKHTAPRHLSVTVIQGRGVLPLPESS